MSTATMPKKTTTRAKKKPPAPEPQRPEPQRPEPRSTVLTIKGTDEWKAWLGGLSDHLRIPTSTIVDLALVRYAKEVGYTAEPPKR